MRNDLAIDRIRNDRRAVRAGAMTREKVRQNIQGDVGGRAADEFAVAYYRESNGNDGITRIRIDRRLRDDKRSGFSGGRVPWQVSYIQRRRGLVCTDNVGPGVEKGAVTSAVLAGRKVVDVAGMPVCSRRNLR